MRKILTGFLGILVVVSIVGGSAYALFTSTATVKGVTFASGDADLKVWSGSVYVTNWNSNLNFSDMFPGYNKNATEYTSLWLKNDSNSAISLDVSMQLTNGGGNWDNSLPLRYATEVAVWDATVGNWATTWINLNDWNTSPQKITLAPIPQSPSGHGNNEREFRLYVRVPENYGATTPWVQYGAKWVGPNQLVENEVANKTLNGVTFSLVGTQVP